jgi:uncharacterized protein
MIIDFRVRPPRVNDHDDKALGEFAEDISKAGVVKAVVMGRFVPGKSHSTLPNYLSNSDVLAICKRHPDLFVGFGSVDIRKPANAASEVSRLADLGLRGIAFDNPESEPATFDDDERLFPIYAAAEKHHMILALTSSVNIGKSVNFSEPSHVQKVANAFPTVPVVVPHACWPWTRQAVALLMRSVIFKESRLYLIPDVYVHTPAPGRMDYIDAMRWSEINQWSRVGTGDLADRFLFASTFPFQRTASALEAFHSFGLSAGIQRRVLYDNAAALLGLR